VIYLFTDFGATDIYVGQVKAVLAQQAPGVPVVDLLHDVPPFQIEAGAHLLAALSQRMPPGAVTLAVVDPGVGTSRRAVVVHAGEHCFVGPDNGLLSVVAARSQASSCREIVWRPAALSRSFHGRDLFAPIAARIAAGTVPSDALGPACKLDVKLDANELAEIVYIDHYGNGMTGLRAGALASTAVLTMNGTRIRHAQVFAQAQPGAAFWYVNSIGLIEIACYQVNAATVIGFRVGDPVDATG
jgi:S-adenosyl-L-methionine hydrolase (adenosine-forming)